MDREIRTKNDVRDFLKSSNPLQLSMQAKQLLVSKLPYTWQRLVEEYGYTAVLMCVRDNLTLGGAQRELHRRLKE